MKEAQGRTCGNGVRYEEGKGDGCPHGEERGLGEVEYLSEEDGDEDVPDEVEELEGEQEVDGFREAFAKDWRFDELPEDEG